MNTAPAYTNQDVSFHLSQTDAFLDTPFDVLSSDSDARSARRAQIERHIDDLEAVQGIFTGKLQRKLGLGFAANLLPSGSTHQHMDVPSVTSRIHSLKSQLNALALISQLPTEILHQILSFRAAHFVEPFRLSLMSKATAPMDLLPWIKVTHVCRKWREVALSDAVLWSQITPAQPSWALEMLSRSGQAPLSFTADYFDLSPRGYEAARAVIQQLSRIRELSLIIPQPNVMRAWLVQPAPILKSFSVRVFRELSPQALPEPLFQGVAPKLRHMSLDNCKIPWNSPLFNGLTVLRLANLVLRIDMLQFLDVFRSMPHLQALRVMNLNVEHQHAELAPAPPVTLSCLNFLTLTGSTPVCAFFLRHLDLPNNPTIYLAFNLRRPQPPNEIVDSFTRHLADTKKPLRHLTIEGLTRSALRLEGSQNQYSKQFNAPRQHFTFRITTDTFPALNDLILEVLAAFLSRLPSSGHLRSIMLKGKGVCNVCRPRLAALDSVTLIVLHGSAGHEWLSHIDSPSGMDALPSLHTIIFLGVAFKHDETSANRSLTAFIDSRRTKYVEIKRLEFQRCDGLISVDILQLQRLVPEVNALF
jgi:hypothetical protein